MEAAKARAPKELKARERALTSQDIEFLARQTPGVRVRRAHALPLYHPQFLGVGVPGVVTVIVVPEVVETVNWPPMPSESTLKAVCAYLNQRRLLTAEVIVAPPKYVRVAVEATVVLQGAADSALVKTKVEAAINRFFTPAGGWGRWSGLAVGGGGVLFGGVAADAAVGGGRLDGRIAVDCGWGDVRMRRLPGIIWCTRKNMRSIWSLGIRIF